MRFIIIIMIHRDKQKQFKLVSILNTACSSLSSADCPSEMSIFAHLCLDHLTSIAVFISLGRLFIVRFVRLLLPILQN